MSHPDFFAQEHPVAVAHRGSMLLWPENTLTAFQGAVDLGYRFLETDLQISRDGVVMVFHDSTLGRTTNGSGPINQRTVEELRRLDAGYQFGPEKNFPWRGQGITIPTLEELVTTFPEKHLILDVKRDGLEEPLVQIMERHNLWDRIIFGALRGSRLLRLREAAPRPIITAATPAEILRFVSAVRVGRAPRIPADLLIIPRRRIIKLVKPTTLAAARQNNLPVVVWTINQRAEMAELLDMGVDGLITDRPDLLQKLMTERGQGGPWNQSQ